MSIETVLIFLVFWSCLIPLMLSDAITYGMTKIVEYQTGNNGVVNYFIAGMCCQPLQAFAFMLDLPFFRNDTVKLLPYSQRRAYFSGMADAVLEDAAKNHYEKVRIFALSVGAIVPYLIGERIARHEIDVEFELECHLINPCQTVKFLKPQVRERLKKGYPVIVFFRILLGPLAFIPLYPASGKRFSYALMSDQVEQILANRSVSLGHRQYVKSVTMSRLDELLENISIHATYAQKHLSYLDGVTHSNTIRAAGKYRTSMEEVLINPHPTE